MTGARAIRLAPATTISTLRLARRRISLRSQSRRLVLGGGAPSSRPAVGIASSTVCLHDRLNGADHAVDVVQGHPGIEGQREDALVDGAGHGKVVPPVSIGRPVVGME